MTTASPDPDTRVSRARYDRERLAREQAEALLEAKSRELFEANRALVAEAEALRRALVEVEQAQASKQAALRTQSVLFAVLDAVAGAKSPAAGLRALLEVVSRTVEHAAVAVIEETAEGQITGVAALDPQLEGLTLAVAPGLVGRARRLPALPRAGWTGPLPKTIADHQSLMLAPLRIPGERPLALICLSPVIGAFSADDLALLEGIAQVAAEPLGNLRLSRRNAALAALIEGSPLPEEPEPSGIDVPFHSINRAFERLTRAQALTVDIVNDLLMASSSGVDAAIARALIRLGQASGADRTVLLLLAPGDRAFVIRDQWVAQTATVPLPDLADSLPDLRAGRDVLIESATPGVAASLVLVPVLHGGELVAALGHAIRDAGRSFLPGEMHLLRSVAHAIHAILRRTAAEAESRVAAEALASERNRLAVTLSALPDLLLEIDPDGRFTDYHSGGIHLPDELVQRFSGFLLEEALPPDLAALGRRILAEVAATGTAEPQAVSFDFGNGVRWLQANAVQRGRDASGAPAGFLLVLRDITRERDQAQEIARLSEVARRTTNLVVVTDAKRRITWVNKAFETSTGWTLDEIAGRDPGHFLQTDRTDPATLATLRVALKAGQPVQVDLLNRSRWGVDYWLHIDIQPLHDAAGELTGFMAVETDITASKALELALEAAAAEAEEARARLIAAVDALQDGFALYDADDRLVLCNDRYREIYPLSADAMRPGMRFEDILRHGLARGEYRAAVGREEVWLAERLAAHRQPENQMEQQLHDGRWLRVYERSTPDGGRVGLRVDITALKEAEARALSDRAAAMDASLDAIAITGSGGTFLYANAAYGKMTHATGLLTGRDWRDLFAADLIATLRTGAMPRLDSTGTWQGDIAGFLADGTMIDVDISLTRRPDGAVLWIMRDLTERHRAESERNRLREDLQLAQRREVIGQLSAGLAHDFNNLIAAIGGSATLIAGETGPDAPMRIRAHAARIERAAEQAGGLVRRLLALGARSNQRRRVDLAACLHEAADLLRPGLPKTIRLALDLPTAPLLAEADPTDILQLVLNLGLNARDAMAGHPAPPGGHVLTLSLAPEAGRTAVTEEFRIGPAMPESDHACIAVTDTGPGLTPEAATRAFSPYFTSKGDKGSGLGLGIVQSITLAAGGAVTLTRGSQGGARFAVHWPLLAEPDQQPVGPLPMRDGAPRLDGCKVLIVDDAEDVLDVLASFLEQAGAEVAPSTSPAEILEALTEDPDAFDILVTDFDMGGMTGADLARAAHALRPDLPVVMVTALPDWRGRDQAGATDPRFATVLAKPATATALVESVLAALGLGNSPAES